MKTMRLGRAVTAVLLSAVSSLFTPAPTALAAPPPPVPRCDVRAGLTPPAVLPRPGAMPTNSTMERIVHRGRLVVAVDLSTYLWMYRDQMTGRVEGFDADLARDLAGALLGDREKVEFLSVDVVGRISAISSGAADLSVSDITATCDRRDEVALSVPYFETSQRTLVERGSGASGLADLGNRPVCAAGGSTSLVNVLSEPSAPVPVAAPDDGRCLALLQLGRVSAVSTDEAILAGLAAQDPSTEIVGPRMTEELYSVAMPRDATDLTRFVNGVLRQRAADGRWLASYDRWLSILGPPHTPTIRYQG